MPNIKTLLPYADVAPVLLDVIYDSFHAIYTARFEGASEADLYGKLRRTASKLKLEKWARRSSVNVGDNPQVLKGIRKAVNSSDDLPRVSMLCIEACRHAQEANAEEEDSSTIFLPSPLAVLVDALAEPTRPESIAYGFALARALLFDCFKVHPPSSNFPVGWKELKLADVQEVIESFRTYATHRDNVHFSSRDPNRVALAHFLGLTGVFRIRFGTAGKAAVPKASARAACLRFLAHKDFLRGVAEKMDYEFRLYSNLHDIPDTQEIINALMGVPLPIRGASTVFFGGLLKSYKGSVVISISGTAGTGKTSLALAIAATLAPFGTQCLYCTFEEDAETLRRRLSGLTPQYFRRSTLPNAKSYDWFSPINLDPTKVKDIDSFSEHYLGALGKRLNPQSPPNPSGNNELPAIAPLLVVVDSLTTLYGGEHESNTESFCKLVRSLRELNCIVLLLSAEDIPRGSRLEYLVDTVIALKYEGTESAAKKPTRLFQLLKSRLQLSRPGSHIFHLSGERGVRISPQLPSQLDAKKISLTPLPKHKCVIDTMFVDAYGVKNTTRTRLIDLYERSRTLIHGHGSSGKAPLALKLLMSPLAENEYRGLEYRMPTAVSRIFVISFLYPEAYYDRNVKKIRATLHRNFPGYVAPEVVTKVLTPGFIGAEDFIGQILAEMDQAKLEGRPYTGVLLDGLHNVFLQFPSLQRSDMVWPTLYNLLMRYDSTIITTFTTFSTPDRPTFQTRNRPAVFDMQDSDIVLKGQLPFLHALVQATDFYFQVEQKTPTNYDRRFLFTVRSALGQKTPNKALVWNADTFAFERFATLDMQSDLFERYPAHDEILE